MFSLSQIANAYNFKQVRSFKEHVKKSGLYKKMPKLLGGNVTVYRYELYTVMEYLGKTPKMTRLYEIPEK